MAKLPVRRLPDMNMLRMPWSGEVAATPAFAGVDSGGTPPSGGLTIGKRSRERERLPLRSFKTREVQKRFGLILAAKMLGLMAVVAIVAVFFYLFESAAGASPMQARRFGTRMPMAP